MEAAEVRGEIRSRTGRGAARQARVGGKVPGILYGAGEETVAIALDTKSFDQLLRKHGSGTFIIDLKLAGQEARDLKTIIKELQRDPVTSRILHVDLQHVSLTQIVDVNLHIQLEGTPLGVKEGGVLEQLLRDVHVQCQASQIPERIVHDVRHLQKGHTIHVSDLVFPDGVTVITPAGRAVAAVVAKAVEAEPVPTAEAAPEGGAAGEEKKEDKKEKAEEPPSKG
ncbi:MAG: 50S ribosomal protein L25 [Candidatus Eisenbacteria bacterium]|nr:50S ribosomal protein L25 [Candidatus Eisenbacteria bacterium]